MKNNPPFGDRRWRLYNTNVDPTESNDLSEQKPNLESLFEAAIAIESADERATFLQEYVGRGPIPRWQLAVSRRSIGEIAQTLPHCEGDARVLSGHDALAIGQ